MYDELTENGTFINIEYHKSRVSELERQLAEYDEIAAEYGIDGKTMLTLAESQIKTAKENIVLREALEESQCREKDAVEFIKYLDRNYSGYMAEDERFAEWRGREEAEATLKGAE